MPTLEVSEDESRLLQTAAWASLHTLEGAAANDITQEDEMIDFMAAQGYRVLIEKLWGT